MDALEVLNNIQSLDVEAIAEATVEDNVEIIADLNATQMSYGLRADGTQILPSYKSAEYAALKYQMNPIPGLGNPDLRNTRAFYKGLYAAVQGEDIEFGSKDAKADALQEKYSTSQGSIFGLTDDSKDDLISGFLQPDWQEKITEATGLDFN